MSTYALFLGCNIPSRVEQYECSSRAVLERLDVDVVDVRRFNCCGYPLRNVDRTAFLLSAAKNLALAESEGADLLVLCKCGYGSLKEAEKALRTEPDLKDRVNGFLKEKGLHYEGNTQVRHLLSVLYHDVGMEAINRSMVMEYTGLNIATHYGCHALRPSNITQFDDPVEPSIFDDLVKVTGATSVEWAQKLECCGAPLLGVNHYVSREMTRKKVSSGLEAGARFICTSCPFCHVQFDTVQEMVVREGDREEYLPPILYTQLLGLCMGLDRKTLGIDKNRLDINGVTSFLS